MTCWATPTPIGHCSEPLSKEQFGEWLAVPIAEAGAFSGTTRDGPDR